MTLPRPGGSRVNLLRVCIFSLVLNSTAEFAFPISKAKLHPFYPIVSNGGRSSGNSHLLSGVITLPLNKYYATFSVLESELQKDEEELPVV
jgi:hypothetical protein